MKWRCEWCGKPHEENDPPCDNCGHGTFEKAVVRETGPTAGSDPETTTVWVCTECGRTHTKHSPPCSRCGNHKLVMEEQRVGDDELDAPGYLDLLTPRYLIGLVVVLGLATVFLLGVTGVVDVPGFGTSVPEVEDVPGSATTAGNASLDDVEESYVSTLNDRRTNEGTSEVSRSEELDEVATYVTRQNVKADYGDARKPSADRVRNLLDERCDGERTIQLLTRQGNETATAAELGVGFALESSTGPDGATEVGVGTHTAPDGEIYLTLIIC
jgi:DNA-directed RNA polymerase subunit RPC12/RpoP